MDSGERLWLGYDPMKEGKRIEFLFYNVNRITVYFVCVMYIVSRHYTTK